MALDATMTAIGIAEVFDAKIPGKYPIIHVAHTYMHSRLDVLTGGQGPFEADET
jgi:hypothetical protein